MLRQRDASVVIVTYNSLPTIGACLESLFSRAASRLAEVVAVDNASSDDTVDALRRDWPQVRIVHNPSNVGLAAANNQGLASVSSPYTVLCNPDVVFRNDAVAELVAGLERHPRAALAGPRMETSGGHVHTSVGDLPRLRDGLAGRFGRGPYRWTYWDHNEERRVGHVVEACYAVRRAAIEEVGPLDDRYFLYWEGADWARRFADAGWETWFVPGAHIEHIGGVSVRRARLRSVVWSHRSMYRYFRKWTRTPAPVLAGLIASRAVLKVGAVALGYRETQPPRVAASATSSANSSPITRQS